MLTLIDYGLTPCPFFEGDYAMRLKYLAELPKRAKSWVSSMQPTYTRQWRP